MELLGFNQGEALSIDPMKCVLQQRFSKLILAREDRKQLQNRQA
ncbi:unnamed protein product [Paramecium pentaurelia]|uniref:Uncharacterized protein n=1 Tax=Paramecium pentaurelia TaxID=43138 RepID=A0A8S1YE55_9CILI|nr:unnamed protein product [Paramecium pentaurelia]